MDKPPGPRRSRSTRKSEHEAAHRPPPAPDAPIELDRYGRRWSFVVTDLGGSIASRWMWDGPDGLVDARAFRPADTRSEVIEALHFWLHDWTHFRATRSVELGDTEWTVRRSSRSAMAGRAPLDEPVVDPSGLYFRAIDGETRFLPLEISGPDFAVLPVQELRDLLARVLAT
jgi:hypothetical protein